MVDLFVTHPMYPNSSGGKFSCMKVLRTVLALFCQTGVETQPQCPSFLSDSGRPQSREGEGGLDGQLCSPLLPSPVDSSQQVKLCRRLHRGRHLLVVMFSHHPSPGGLPPLISTPRLVTCCRARSECTGRRQHWLQMAQLNVLSINSWLDSQY